MPDDLYTRDILQWSAQQAALLRRLAAGERVNDVDWPNVIDEVESVGRSEMRACPGLLFQAIRHMLKIAGWPLHPAIGHWTRETLAFLDDAERAFAPSMRQNIDIADLYTRALGRMRFDEMHEQPPGPLPPHCPFTLDDLLDPDRDIRALLARLDAPPAR